jgi:hypothetical protein
MIDNKKVPLKSLQYNSKANQMEVMRNWFYKHYEDPANACPYNSREGGYAYIYGGPYEADNELQMNFGGFVKDDFIQELVDELQTECFEWSGNSRNTDWYDDDLYDAVTTSNAPFAKFSGYVEGIKSLASEEFKGEAKAHLLSLLYTNVITALETLFVELFISAIDEDASYVADFIEKGKSEFKVSKEIAALPFKGEPIEKVREELLKAVKEHLISASWHNADRVVKRFKATFAIELRQDWPVDEIEIATLKRNHLVHRGGKDKEGNAVVITEQDLEELLGHATSIGEKLYRSLEEAILAKKAGTEPGGINRFQVNIGDAPE